MATSFPEIVATEAGNLLEPLKKLNSASSIEAFVKSLGWDFSGTIATGGIDIAGMVTEVETLITKITGLTEAEEEEKLDALSELIDQIITVVGKLRTEIPNIESALGSVSSLSGPSTDFVKTFLRRALDLLIYEYLEDYVTPAFGALYILKIADKATDADSGLSYKTIYWNQFGLLFSNPIQLFNDGYDWDSDFKHDEFLKRFSILMKAFLIPGGIYDQSTTISANLGRPSSPVPQEIRMPLYQEGVWGDNWMEIDLNISPIPEVTSSGKKAGLYIYPYFYGSVDLNADINENWTTEISGAASIGGGLGLEIRPPAQLTVVSSLFTSPSESIDLSAAFKLENKDQSIDNIIIGSPEGTYLSYRKVALSTFASKTGSEKDFGLELQLGTLKFVLAIGGDGDGLLQQVLPESFTTELDLGLGYSIAKGFYFSASGTFEVHFNAHFTIGPVEVRGLFLAFSPGADGIGLDMGATIKVELGPFTAVVEGMGLESALTFPEDGGRLGPLDYEMGFRPPTGIGLALETDVVKGGGYLFFDRDKGEYGGALELSIKDMFSVAAIGLVSTINNEDGSKTYSLLLIVSVQFTPGIALGMGFFLSGLGGIIGIHRTMNVDALREGVSNNALDSILFPEDIIQNIDRIIADIKDIFPTKKDQFLLGLMAKITYGSPTLISVEFGLIVEFPNPIVIAILGVIKTALPTEDEAVLKLQVNFLGIIDFEKKYLSFDASIVNSRILTFTLEGDMAMRLFWGEEKAFLISVGGFHPSFQPPQALKVGSMKRLTLSLLSGNPSLTLTTYFALTSNTIQFGASIDFLYSIAGFQVIGYFGFDVLFQFSPFWFIAGIRAGVAIKKGSTTLLAISLAFELSGPKPWSALGTAEFKVLFIKVKVRFSKVWGENSQVTIDREAVLPKLLEAFEQSDNWTSELLAGEPLLVSLNEVELAEGVVLLHPSGKLTINQNVMPLEMTIAKFGNTAPQDIKKAKIIRVLLNNEEVNISSVTNAFASANFIELSDKDKLSAPSYSDEKSGAALSDIDALEASYAINRDVTYEVRSSDYDSESETPYEFTTSNNLGTVGEKNQKIFTKMANRGIGRSSALSKKKKAQLRDKTIEIEGEKFAVVSTENLTKSLDVNFDIGTKAEADQALKNLLYQRPELKNSLQVVADYEVAE